MVIIFELTDEKEETSGVTTVPELILKVVESLREDIESESTKEIVGLVVSITVLDSIEEVEEALGIAIVPELLEEKEETSSVVPEPELI